MDIGKFVFSHAFGNEEYGTMTFYFVGGIDSILDGLEPQLREKIPFLIGDSLAGISIEFPSDRPEPKYSSVEVGIYETNKDGSKNIVEWMDQKISYEDIEKLIDRGFKELEHCRGCTLA